MRALRREVVSAAEREAQEIVAAARADSEQTLVRAQRELGALRAQVAAVGVNPADYASLSALSENVAAAQRLLGGGHGGEDSVEATVLFSETVEKPRGHRALVIAAVTAVIAAMVLAALSLLRGGSDEPSPIASRSLEPMPLAVSPGVVEVPPAAVGAGGFRPGPMAGAGARGAGVADTAGQPGVALNVTGSPAVTLPPGASASPVAAPTPSAATATGGTATEAGATDVDEAEQIRSAVQRWFDAYHRGHQAGMRAAAGAFLPSPMDAGRHPPTRATS